LANASWTALPVFGPAGRCGLGESDRGGLFWFCSGFLLVICAVPKSLLLRWIR